MVYLLWCPHYDWCAYKKRKRDTGVRTLLLTELSSQYSYVKALNPNVTVFGDKALGR